MSDVGFGILLGLVAAILFANFVTLMATINHLKYLREIRDLLKDRKGQ